VLDRDTEVDCSDIASVDPTEARNTMASERRDLAICAPVVTRSSSAWRTLHEPYADRLGTIRSSRSRGSEKTYHDQPPRQTA
jgi:hypothetical protein